MAEMSLEDLKRQNAEPVAEQVEEPVEEDVEQEAQPEPEAEQDEDDKVDEAWMASDDEPSKDRKFTDRDIGAAKAALRAKLERKHNAEVEALKQQLNQLQQAVQPPAKLPPRPREEDFDYDQDRYAKALEDWDNKRLRSLAAQQTEELRRQQLIEQQKRVLQQAEDQHYERAAKLIAEHGIKPELYKDADARVKGAIDRIRPGEAELITAQLANVIGEGSEKVFYYLGRNSEALATFEAKLIQDPTGIQAVAYLSRKAAEITMPKKTVSKAPEPPTQIRGDVSSVSTKDLKRKYQDAHRKGDVQGAFDAKRRAKAAGVDTSTW